MRTSIRIAALILGGAMFIGCDNKDNTTVAPPATPPAMPNTSAAADAMKNAADTAKTDAKNATDAAKAGMQNATDTAKAEAKKLEATSMPSMPAMPK